MPDILNDAPASFAAQLPDLDGGDSPDFALHNDARQALRALNQFAFADRGAPGLTVRSVIEDGALADDATDNLAAFQATVNAVADAGGGIALVPAAMGIFAWDGTLEIPANVILRGLGDRSVVRGRPARGRAAIRFASGTHRGGLENLVLHGDERLPPSIGIDLTGSQFLRLRNFQIWNFQLGLRLSDGRTSFAAYNHVSDFEVNSCHVGIRAWRHCNHASVHAGRIHFCRNKGAGLALDIRDAEALTIAHIAIEDFDVGVRVTGLTSVSLRDIYYEADVPGNPFPPGVWMDIRPARGSIVRMENSLANVNRSLVMAGSLEDAITNDARSHVFNGAKRHHAAAPERNLVENGDFHRADGLSVPGWSTNFAPIVAENLMDFVTAGRSYDLTQASNANDGLVKSFTVPETTDYVTIMVRYKNISSASLLFRVVSGVNAALFADSLPPAGDEWRVAAITVEVDPSAAGVVSVTLTADQSAAGGQIRVDELWGVVGATAAPPRAHAHRIEFLPTPFNVVTRSALRNNSQFGPIGLVGLPGLGGAPRGVIGAVLSLRGITSPAGDGGILDPSGIGATLPRAVRPFLQEPVMGERWTLDLVFDRLEHDRQVMLRGTSFQDGISVFDNSMATTYRIDVIGWVLPS